MESGGVSPWCVPAGTFSLGSTVRPGGLGLHFYKDRGPEDLGEMGGGGRVGNYSEKPLLRFLKIKVVSHRRELFQSKVPRFPVILCKIDSSRVT